MRSSFLLLTAVALVLPAVAHADSAPPDSGRFIVFQGDMPIGNEQFKFQFLGDSLALTAVSRRTLQDEKGARHQYQKSMVLIADVRDFALQRYLSVQEFQGVTVHRGLVPGDTSITFYFEEQGAGNAFRLVQPPGRLYVMDSPMFSLFEAVTRGLAGKQFTTRNMQLLALTDSMSTPIAKVTLQKPDTLKLGGKPVPVRHYRFEDSGASFDLYADARGRLIRMVHGPTGLHIEREPDPEPAKPASSKSSKKK
jgi:hypothetical protein